jgi:hypothetical protein
MDAIVEVMDANQTTINAKGTGFKGFIPALFARLVNEAFVRRVRFFERSINPKHGSALQRQARQIPFLTQRAIYAASVMIMPEIPGINI